MGVIIAKQIATESYDCIYQIYTTADEEKIAEYKVPKHGLCAQKEQEMSFKVVLSEKSSYKEAAKAFERWTVWDGSDNPRTVIKYKVVALKLNGSPVNMADKVKSGSHVVSTRMVAKQKRF